MDRTKKRKRPDVARKKPSALKLSRLIVLRIRACPQCRPGYSEHMGMKILDVLREELER